MLAQAGRVVRGVSKPDDRAGCFLLAPIELTACFVTRLAQRLNGRRVVHLPKRRTAAFWLGVRDVATVFNAARLGCYLSSQSLPEHPKPQPFRRPDTARCDSLRLGANCDD